MGVMRIRPSREALSLRDAMSQLMEDSFVRPYPRWAQAEHEGHLRLPVDIYTTPDELVLTASLPGLLPEEVEITIEGDTLTIRGELRAPLDNVDYIFQERSHGAFSRSLTLNVPVDVDNTEAVFENGVLTLTMPKVEEVRPKSIKITTK